MSNPRLKLDQKKSKSIIQKNILIKPNSKSLTEKTWWQIDEQILNYCDNRKTKINFENSLFKRCKSIRVFVSSTFTDFFNEREHLVKFVFPELREWCFKRNLDLIECDLRWGVPIDSTNEDTIQTCLSEIDRCLEENDGQPFFVGMLGQKYGWVPSVDQLSDYLKHKYNWIPNISITHMEFLHGALRCQNRNACFFIRNDLDFIPDEYKDKFIETNKDSLDQLNTLKSKLSMYHREQVFRYSCDYDGIDDTTGRKKVKLKNLKKFGELVLNYLKFAIEQTYPQLKPIYDFDDVNFESNDAQKEKLNLFFQDEQSVQDLFIVEKTHFFIGYETETSSILDYTKGFLEQNQNECQVCLVHGQPGSGKTCFMSMLTKSLIEKNKIEIFYHFFQASCYSQFTRTFLCRFIFHFSKILELEDNLEFDTGYDSSQTLDSFKKIIDLLTSKKDSKFIILLDGYNYDSNDYFKWLPLFFNSANIKFILSCTNNTINEIDVESSFKINLECFNDETSKEFIQKYLKNYNKRLDENQMKLILEKSNLNKSPLWLSLVCNELRVFGEFTTINKKIQNLPFHLSDLIKHILNRISLDFSNDIIKQALILIALSRNGLPENEIYILLNKHCGFKETNRLEWAHINRCLKIFFKYSHFQKTQLVSIRHEQVKQIIEDMYLTSDTIVSYHNKLIQFYRFTSMYRMFSCYELCHHYKMTWNKNDLAEYLRTREARSLINASYRAFLFNGMRCKHLPIKNDHNHLKMCTLCSNKIGDLSIFSANKSSCFVCGSFMVSSTLSSSKDVLIYKCMKHGFKESHMQTSYTFVCCICKKIVSTPNGVSINLFSNAKLCLICNPLFCCMLETD